MAVIENAELIQARRKALGLQLVEVARAAGVTRSFIGNLEAGIETRCSDDTAAKIEAVLSRGALDAKNRADRRLFDTRKRIFSYGGPRTRTRLSEADRVEIRHGFESGESVALLAERFGVARNTVTRIVKEGRHDR